MLRKVLFSIMAALCTVMLLVTVAFAQTGSNTTDSDSVDDETAVTVVENAAAANVVQTVPVTLTLVISSPTGPITVEVPLFLSLDIRIGFSPELTPTVQVTSTLLTEEDNEDEESGVITDTEESTTTLTLATVEPTSTPTEEPTATPEVTATPILTPTATPTAEPVAVAPLCPDASTVITSPGVNEEVSGTVDIYGTAVGDNFQYYKVEYAEGADIDPNSTFAFLSDARLQITGGLLSSFDSTEFVNGPYTIKLTVVDNSGNFPPPCTVTVLVAN